MATAISFDGNRDDVEAIKKLAAEQGVTAGLYVRLAVEAYAPPDKLKKAKAAVARARQRAKKKATE